MLILVTGGSGSGKSAYAEQLLTGFQDSDYKAYIATMQVYDEEGIQRIQRHRRLRADKGFVTIEQPVRIMDALSVIRNDSEARQEMRENAAKGSYSALLECMSNLVANEMFQTKDKSAQQPGAEQIPEAQDITDRIITEIRQLYSGLRHLVIVTNNVFEDGSFYDASTMEYISVLGQINRRLAELSDQVVEVVAGIPVILKIKE